MKLFHRSNYWGTTIDSSCSDDEVSFDAIWVQAVDDFGSCRRGCCRGFGRRAVPVENSDFVDEHNGLWSLYRVSGTRGTPNSAHYFWKFALVPKGTYRYGRRGCSNRGWRFVGDIDADTALQDLDDLLVQEYLEDDDDDVPHVHIGIMMDSLYAPKRR